MTHVALEASSHGLAQSRLDGVRLAAGAFTNLTRDHLDYHPTFEDYSAAKLRLFTEVLAPTATAVINADTEAAPEFVAAGARPRPDRPRCRRARRAAAPPQADPRRPWPAAQDRRRQCRLRGLSAARRRFPGLQCPDRRRAGASAPAAIRRWPSGAWNPSKVRAAGSSWSPRPQMVRRSLSTMPTRPMRWRRFSPRSALCQRSAQRGVRRAAATATVASARRWAPSPPRLANEVYRHRRQSAQRGARRPSGAAILAACPGAIEIGDRAEAIFAAIAGLKRGDVLVVAGKGHETGQIVGKEVLPFSDQEVVRAAVEGRPRP